MSLVRSLFFSVTIIGSLGLAAIAQEQLSGNDAIDARKELMRSNASIMPTAAEATGTDAVAVGEQLVANFQRLPQLFPDDSKVGETRAAPLIWDDASGFAAEIAAAQAAAKDVLDAANANDTNLYIAAVEAMGARCGSCHSQYRTQ